MPIYHEIYTQLHSYKFNLKKKIASMSKSLRKTIVQLLKMEPRPIGVDVSLKLPSRCQLLPQKKLTPLGPNTDFGREENLSLKWI